MTIASYREPPKHVCPYHDQIQAATWGRGWSGWYRWRCVACSGHALWWRWILNRFVKVDIPTGPGPYLNSDPR